MTQPPEPEGERRDERARDRDQRLHPARLHIWVVGVVVRGETLTRFHVCEPSPTAKRIPARVGVRPRGPFSFEPSCGRKPRGKLREEAHLDHKVSNASSASRAPPLGPRLGSEGHRA